MNPPLPSTLLWSSSSLTVGKNILQDTISRKSQMFQWDVPFSFLTDCDKAGGLISYHLLSSWSAFWQFDASIQYLIFYTSPFIEYLLHTVTFIFCWRYSKLCNFYPSLHLPVRAPSQYKTSLVFFLQLTTNFFFLSLSSNKTFAPYPSVLFLKSFCSTHLK